MATLTQPTTQAPVTLRNSVEKLPECIFTIREGRARRKNPQRSAISTVAKFRKDQQMQAQQSCQAKRGQGPEGYQGTPHEHV